MTSSHTPRVTVLMPVRNGMPWLPDAVASIVRQSFTDLELLVLEDGSVDGTVTFLATIEDPRVRVIPTGGVGVAAALNVGLGEARGAYVARQDADDESVPGRLHRQVQTLDAQPEIDVVATLADYVDEQGAAVENDWTCAVRLQHDPALTPSAIARLMPLTCCVTHGSVMARTGVLRAAGGYRPAFEPAEDYDLWLRLLPAARFLKLDERLYRYRLHGLQTMHQPNRRQSVMAVTAKLQYVRRQFGHVPVPARLAIVGMGPGVDVYRAGAASAGFNVVGIDQTWDVLAVTELARASTFGERLTGHDGSISTRVGNLFVRSTERALRATA